MREFRLIKEAINNFDLNLEGLTVLTEAASGNYVWTPIIAALAGAKVNAYSTDSKHASFREVKEKTEYLAKEMDVYNNISIHNVLNKEIISSADIITNTGFLRPLDKEKLQYSKDKVVIPLMYETWEFRNSDIDLNYCKENKIPVFGTNESDNRLKTIEYLGSVVKKALFLNDIEVFHSKIVVLGIGKFAEAIYNSLKNEATFIEIWNSEENIKNIESLDAIIVADHQSNNLYIAPKGIIIPELLKKYNPSIRIIHISGNIDKESLEKNNLNFFPNEIAKTKWMSLTTDFVGPKPVIDLHTAGLKVGETIYTNYEILKTKQKINSLLTNNLIQELST